MFFCARRAEGEAGEGFSPGEICYVTDNVRVSYFSVLCYIFEYVRFNKFPLGKTWRLAHKAHPHFVHRRLNLPEAPLFPTAGGRPAPVAHHLLPSPPANKKETKEKVLLRRSYTPSAPLVFEKNLSNRRFHN